jgi:hypothetical protein
MKYELIDCENVILREIATPEAKRRDIAQTYRLCMESSECDRIDWAKVNGAILERWSRSALEWIKKQAHSGRCFAAGGR